MANDNEFIPILDCDESAFITIEDINENCQANGDLSQIKYLLLSDSTQNPPVLPLDWTDPIEWAAVIDNSVNNGTKIKQLLGIGGVEEAPGAERDMPAHKTVFGENTYTLTFRIASPTQAVYNFLQKMEASRALPYFWFVTVDGIMFGSPVGIVSSSKRTPFKLDAAKDAYEEYEIILTWKSYTRPLRIVSPI
jgi:hypothetical protein